MEGPLHTVRRAAFSAMLDGRDWLAEEWRTLYLPPLAAADASSIAFFSSPPSLPSLAHGWPACGWGSEGEGDWEQEIKRLYGLCIKQSILSRASVPLLLLSFIFQSSTAFIQASFYAPCLLFPPSTCMHTCGKYQLDLKKINNQVMPDGLEVMSVNALLNLRHRMSLFYL